MTAGLTTLFASHVDLQSAFAQAPAAVATGQASKQPEDASDKALKAVVEMMKGKWKVQSMEFNGASQAPAGGAPDAIETKDTHINFLSGGKVIPRMSKLQMTCDPLTDAKPSEPIKLNLSRPSQPGQEEILPCLVMVKDKELKFAMPMVSPNRDPNTPIDRPKSFDTKTGAFVVLKAKRAGE